MLGECHFLLLVRRVTFVTAHTEQTKSYKEWFERFQCYRGIATQSIESSERKKGVE
jgi:hypothetical protein